MNKWEDVYVLLQVASLSLQWPQLKALHDQAIATLAAVDPNTLAFAGQHVEPIEPLEDE